MGAPGAAPVALPARGWSHPPQHEAGRRPLFYAAAPAVGPGAPLEGQAGLPDLYKPQEVSGAASVAWMAG